MTDRIDFGSEPWQAIPRRVLRDRRLSARAKGGLVTLLSHEEGWVRSSIGVLQRECDIGRKQAQSIMAELVELGYARLITSPQEEGSNLVKSSYEVSATPQTPSSETGTMPFPTYRKPTGSETDRVGKVPAVVEALDVEALEVEPQGQEPKARKRDPANPHQPTHDQVDLAEKLSATWGQELSIPAVVKLNKAHGRLHVENALRELRGFPPKEAVESLYAYVASIAEHDAEAAGA